MQPPSARKQSRLSCQSLIKVFVCGLLLALLLQNTFSAGMNVVWQVNAQEPDTLLVLPPETDRFPELSVQFKPQRAATSEAFALDIDDLSVLENGRGVTIIALEQQRGGVHFTLAINGDRRFDLRDSQGISPYDRIRDTLNDWVNTRRFTSGDTLSFFTRDGAVIRNTAIGEDWIEALENYQPPFRTMTPDLTGLEAALQAAEERIVPFGVDKAILYITPPPNREDINQVLALTEVARSAGIQVNVWMLGEEFFLTNEQGRALIDLAALTGGQFLHYIGPERPPSPEAYLEDLGVFYTMRFESGIRTPGTYAIVVVAALPGGELRGNSGDFAINVQPPKPIFLSPPATIIREASPGWEGEPENLTPSQVTIEFIIEFPDRYPRDLAGIYLIVNGQVVDKQDDAPFAKSAVNQALTWDLSSISEPGSYELQVVVEDTLGLQGETIVIPIEVEVERFEPETSASGQQVGVMVVWGLMAVSVTILLIYFIQRLLMRNALQKLILGLTNKRKDADAGQENLAFATLLPLLKETPEGFAEVIAVSSRNMTFGSDAEQVSQLVQGDDIAGMHARLRVRDGVCYLTDSGSDGGTWVNYQRIERDPHRLQPGDLIHFGSVGFRFTTIDPASPPRAAVSKYEKMT